MYNLSLSWNKSFIRMLGMLPHPRLTLNPVGRVQFGLVPWLGVSQEVDDRQHLMRAQEKQANSCLFATNEDCSRSLDHMPEVFDIGFFFLLSSWSLGTRWAFQLLIIIISWSILGKCVWSEVVLQHPWSFSVFTLVSTDPLAAWKPSK